MSISSLSQRFSNYFLGPVDRYFFTEKLKSDSEFRDQFSSFRNKIIEIIIARNSGIPHIEDTENTYHIVCEFIDDIILSGKVDYFNNKPLYKALIDDESLQKKIKVLFPNKKNIHRINAQDLKEKLKIQIETFSISTVSISSNFSYFSDNLKADYQNKFYTRLQNLIKDPTKKYDLSKINNTVKKFIAYRKIERFHLKNQDLINRSDCDEMLFQALLTLDINEFFTSSISQENFQSRGDDLISCISTPKFIKEIVESKKTTLIESIKNKITELKFASTYDFNQIKNTLECFFQEPTEQTNTDNINQAFLDDLNQKYENDLKQILENSEPNFKKTASIYFILEILTPDYKELPEQKAEFLDQIKAEVENRLNQNNCTSLQLKNALLHFFADMNPSESNNELPQNYDHPFYNFLLLYQSELFNIINQNSLDDMNTVATELSEKALELVDIEIKEHKDKLISDVKNKIQTAKNLHELEIIQNSLNQCIDKYKLGLDPSYQKAYDDTYINDDTNIETNPKLVEILFNKYFNFPLSNDNLDEIKQEFTTLIEKKFEELVQEAKNNKKEKTLEFEGNFFHAINKEVEEYCSRAISTDKSNATLNKFFDLWRINLNTPDRTDFICKTTPLVDKSIDDKLLHALDKKHLKKLSLILRQKNSTEEIKFYQEILLKFQSLNRDYIQKIEPYNYKKILEIIYKFKDLEPDQKELFWSTMQILSEKYSNLDPETIWHFIDHIFSMPDQEKRQYWLNRVKEAQVDDDGYAVKTEEDEFYLTNLETRAKNLKEKSEGIFETQSGRALLDFLDQREMSSELNIQYKEFFTDGIELLETAYQAEFGYQKIRDQQEALHLEINIFSGQRILNAGNYDVNRTPIPEIIYKILSYKERGLLEEIRGLLWSAVRAIVEIYNKKMRDNQEYPNDNVAKEINKLRKDNDFTEKVLEFIRERRTINQEPAIDDADEKIIMEFFYNQLSNKAF